MSEDNSLDFSLETFQELLAKTADIVLEQFADLPEQKGYHSPDQEEVASWFADPIPEKAGDPHEILEFVREKVIKTATGNTGTNMYAYVMAGGNQMGILSEQLSATINQNVGKWHLAPALTEIEKRVIQWTGELLGIGSNAGGVMVSGGSGANLTGLTVARNIYFQQDEIRKKGLFNMKPFTIYASSETHNCIDKSVDLLGLGSDHLRKINVNPDKTINLDLLESAIVADIENGFKPFCLVGNAGTVNTGAIDDLIGLSRIARKYELWFHVDGAYGGLASILPTKKKLYQGMEMADSIAVDFHKWFYVPFESGCVVVKNWSELRETYFKKAAYLDTELESANGRLDFNEYNFQLSRSSKALKVWMTLKTFGLDRIKQMILKDIELTDYLNDLIDQSSDFRIVAKSNLAISCFQFIGDLKEEADIIRFNKELVKKLESDGRIFITGTTIDQSFVLRACLINHRKDKPSVDYLLKVIREVASKIDL